MYRQIDILCISTNQDTLCVAGGPGGGSAPRHKIKHETIKDKTKKRKKKTNKINITQKEIIKTNKQINK